MLEGGEMKTAGRAGEPGAEKRLEMILLEN
jgi:hypothetical protein